VSRKQKPWIKIAAAPKGGGFRMRRNEIKPVSLLKKQAML